MDKIIGDNWVLDIIYKNLHEIYMKELNNEFKEKLIFYDRFPHFALMKINKLYFKVCNYSHYKRFRKFPPSDKKNKYYNSYNWVVWDYKRKLQKYDRIKNKLLFKINYAVNI